MMIIELPYILKTSQNQVELWSSVRLPFEPTGWKKTMRQELRECLRSSKSGNNSILYAYYTSTKAEYVDIENVLFYNVGASAYRHLSKNGICFEKRNKIPSHIGVLDHLYEYYQCYYFGDSPDFRSNVDINHILAEWSSVHCTPLKGDNKPHSFWYEMKQAHVVVKNKLQDLKDLGIRLIIRVPRNEDVNLASSVKPMLDGIISAFHSHDGSNIETISYDLAEYLDTACGSIINLLLSDEFNVLGKRRLVSQFRNSIKWNPGDDKIVKAEILLGEPSESEFWYHEGEIYRVVA